MKDYLCTSNTELLAVNFHPYDVPKQFSCYCGSSLCPSIQLLSVLHVTLGSFYANVRGACSFYSCPLPSKADPNLVFLTSTYTPIVWCQSVSNNCEKVNTSRWKKKKKSGYFAATSGHILCEPYQNDNVTSEYVGNYINFCYGDLLSHQSSGVLQRWSERTDE